MTRTLMQLVEGLGLRPADARNGAMDLTITDVTDDSRQATPGCLFVVRTGGEAYVDQAMAARPAAVIAPPEVEPRGDAVWLTCTPEQAATQHLAGELAARFFDHPSRKLAVIGITGTKGKTTTAILTQHLLAATGHRCGLIGTIWLDDGATRRPAQLTTPGAIEFTRLLAAMVAHGCRAAAVEVSSHALHQHRVASTRFAVGVFTNLTGDHLDYHGTMDAYADAKAILFKSLPPGAWAVINADDLYAHHMADAVPPGTHRVWTTMRGEEGVSGVGCRVSGAEEGVSGIGYRVSGAESGKTTDMPLASDDTRHPIPDTRSPSNDTRCLAVPITLGADHSVARYDGPWGSFELRIPLVGRHNVSNALQAIAAANCVAAQARTLRDAMRQCPTVPGRLEPVRVEERVSGIGYRVSGEGNAKTTDTPTAADDTRYPIPDTRASLPTVLVDYAHTHDSLEKTLLALRPVTQGRLIVLFGCGGDRDKTKRPKMAAVACKLADVVVITSDNPRTEDPQAIIRDILAGIPAGERVSGAESGKITDTPSASGDTRHPTPDTRSADPDTRIHVEPDRAAAIRAAVNLARPGAGDTVLLAGKGHEDYQIIGKTKRHFDDREHAAEALRAYQPLLTPSPSGRGLG